MDTETQVPLAPGTQSRQVGPPKGRNATTSPGAADPRMQRRTVETRPLVTPILSNDHPNGYSPTDRYVREFLIPLVGPGAVADLLRLTAAAHSGRPIRLPINLTTLVREGFASRSHDAEIVVPPKVQPLAQHQVRRLPPSLRRTHRAAAGIESQPL